MVKLRDGSEVADARLARLVQFDERSKDFPVMATVGATKKPRSYTWRCRQYLDQGAEGACVGFAMTHELIGRPAEVAGLDSDFARVKVYWEAQKIDPWEGGSYPGAAPFYEGTSVLAGVKVLKKLGYIEQYRWAFGLQDLVMAVGYCGPAVLGVPWYEGMFEPWSCGHLHAHGQLVGGHAILCKGVDVKNQTFTLHNSWGPGSAGAQRRGRPRGRAHGAAGDPVPRDADEVRRVDQVGRAAQDEPPRGPSVEGPRDRGERRAASRQAGHHPSPREADAR